MTSASNQDKNIETEEKGADKLAEQESNTAQITDVEYGDYMGDAYLRYAMDVLEDRALPDVRDGLKPVQRRILYSMHELNLRASGQFKKSARTVGHTISFYHPHGDSSIYDAMVVMAQDFKQRYPMVSGNGNFGDLDGDPPAAMRYTEAKLSRYGEKMLQDIDKDTVPFHPNFDESTQEPEVLSGLVPNLLLNGNSGIAVGLACSFAPHYAGDVYKALDTIIGHALEGEDTSEEELIDIVRAPDFPTGGVIVNPSDVRQAYRTGRGSIQIRSKYHIERIKKHDAIIITEIPYNVNKAMMVKKMDERRLSGAIPDIRSVCDETDRDGVRIVVELRDNADTNVILHRLLKETPMQSSFSLNHNALVNGHVQEGLTLKQLFEYFLEHATNVVRNRVQYDYQKDMKRKHIVDALVTVLSDENLDSVIELIRSSEDEAAAAKAMSVFGLDEEQGAAIASMRLGALSHAPKDRYLKEQESLRATTEHAQLILSDTSEFLKELRSQLDAVAQSFPKEERRTEIEENANDDYTERDLVKEQDIVITYTQNGIIKSTLASEYNAHNRGTRGQSAGQLRDDDAVRDVISLTTKDDLLFFTDLGYCHVLPAYKIPIGKKSQAGKYVANYLSLSEGESILTMIAWNKEHENSTILMATRRGLVKRIDKSIFSSRASKTRVITLNEDDMLAAAVPIEEGKTALLVTTNGKATRFDPYDENYGIRTSGRAARGVRGMKLTDGDLIADLLPCEPDGQLLMITQHGYTKKTLFEEIPLRHRGSHGVILFKPNENTGLVIAACVAKEDHDLFIVTENGIINRITTDTIRTLSRSASGVRSIRLEPDDSVVAIAMTPQQEEEEEEEVDAENDG